MDHKDPQGKHSFLSLRKNRPDFAFQKTLQPPLRQYLEYYDVRVNQKNYWFGYINSDNYAIAAHLTIPQGPVKGTLVLVHGFLSHFAFYQDIIPLLLESGWAVAGLDLPGHGLSTGEPTGIDDFSSYGKAIAALVDTIEPHVSGPLIALGHSMGCASLLEYRLKSDGRMETYIFVAPLVRSTMYGLTQFGFAIFNPLIKTLPRIYQKTSNDEEYLDFKENHDPLQSEQIEPSWVHALFNWNSRIEETEIPSMDLIIIQGDQDRVVDFSYNIDFYTSRLPDTQVYYIPGGRHELPRESPEYKNVFVAYLMEILKTRGRSNE